ncbi:30S ribosomal protein S12 methylthiotransferase RimO [Bacteroidetes/Chlorobi group bacterium ChocPot_Mid]|nr:MAG: 30S ribosomal protein S12 methylthiotransferase RimO [Bacteroidetes/Chlorobi group bacterium ChocPot_Mid]
MAKKTETISLLTLGCSKNTVDSENMIGKLESAGFSYISNTNKADNLIINTCGFIKPAKEESLQVIVDALELKKQGKIKNVIVTGCLAERYKDEISSQLDDIDFIIGLNSTEKILHFLKPDLKKELTGERHLLTPKHFAYLKISEGCNHKCSFCAIPLIRGKYLSRSQEDLLEEATSLSKAGVKELNIIAQDTTYYGVDLFGKSQLAKLLRNLSDLDKFEWIRLLYTYPLNFPTEVLDIINERKNICKYIDIPLQHSSSAILKAMKRKMNHEQTSDLIDLIREKISDVAIRSTFIVGFPGETEKDFQQLYDFILYKKLERVGIFTYSREEDTKAFGLGDTIPEDVKQERRDILMKAQMQISLDKNKSLIGKQKKVIIDERIDKMSYSGRTEHDAPEVDNSVIIKSKTKIPLGSFQFVKITDATEYDLIGQII